MQASSQKVVPPSRSAIVNLLTGPFEHRHPKAWAGVPLLAAYGLLQSTPS